MNTKNRFKYINNKGKNIIGKYTKVLTFKYSINKEKMKKPKKILPELPKYILYLKIPRLNKIKMEEQIIKR